MVAGCGGDGGEVTPPIVMIAGERPAADCVATEQRKALAFAPPGLPGLRLRASDVANFSASTPLPCNARRLVYWTGAVEEPTAAVLLEFSDRPIPRRRLQNDVTPQRARRNGADYWIGSENGTGLARFAIGDTRVTVTAGCAATSTTILLPEQCADAVLRPAGTRDRALELAVALKPQLVTNLASSPSTPVPQSR